MTDRPDPARPTLDHASWSRHQYHRMILPGGVVAFAAPLWLHHQQPFLAPFDQQALPLMLATYVLLTALSWLSLPLFWLECAIIVQLGRFVTWRVGAVPFTPDLDARAGQLAAILPWVIVALLIASWVVPERASLSVNGIVVGAIALLGVAWWPPRPSSSRRPSCCAATT